MVRASKVWYPPVSLAASVGGGLLAGAVFRRVWQAVGDDQPPPEPKDLSRYTRDGLVGAALQGVVFSLARAAVDRATAHGYRAVTQESPP